MLHWHITSFSKKNMDIEIISGSKTKTKNDTISLPKIGPSNTLSGNRIFSLLDFPTHDFVPNIRYHSSNNHRVQYTIESSKLGTSSYWNINLPTYWTFDIDLSTHRSIELLVHIHITLSGYWLIGVSSYQFIGTSTYGFIGTLGLQILGILEHLYIKILGYWNLKILGFRNLEILGYDNIGLLDHSKIRILYHLYIRISRHWIWDKLKSSTKTLWPILSMKDHQYVETSFAWC